jgi:hypothetical protein
MAKTPSRLAGPGKRYLAGVMIISPLFLGGQQNTVVAAAGVAEGALPT